MGWDKESLYAKAKLYIGRGLSRPRESDEFGLWCALGLELLGRAAVAAVSPTLLAEPDANHSNLLHALGRGDPRGARSIDATKVFSLCKALFKSFNDADEKAARALLGRRNEELHTGGSAFGSSGSQSAQEWLPGFYLCCKKLTATFNESLADLLGIDEASIAEDILQEVDKEIEGKVKSLVKSHNQVFMAKPLAEREALCTNAQQEAEKLAKQRHHRVECPACSSPALLQGDTFGAANLQHDEDTGAIIIRQAVVPRVFNCRACGLSLNGYPHLSAANLGAQYTRTTRYTPEEYFDLIHPDDHEKIIQLAEAMGMESRDWPEYDNE